MTEHNKEDSIRLLLREKRKERGSQRKVAMDLSITELTLRKIERRKGDPSIKLMFKIGKYFGESVYDLFPDLADQEL